MIEKESTEKALILNHYNRQNCIIDGSVNLEVVIKNIQQELLENEERKEKYTKFLKYLDRLQLLWIFEMLPNAKSRAKLMKLVYYAMRFLDDVIDKDVKTDFSNEEGRKYVDQRITILTEENFSANDVLDCFLKEIKKIAEEFGMWSHVKQGLLEIMHSMLFDAKRIEHFEKTGEYQTFPQAELDDHFFGLDIKGTCRDSFWIFGFTPSEKTLETVAPLSWATRINYNIQDIFSDIAHGLINISQEDMTKYKITKDHFKEITKKYLEKSGPKNSYNELPDPVKKYVLAQIVEAENLIKQHRKNMLKFRSFESRRGNLSLGDFIKELPMKLFVFPKAYISEIRETFRQVESDFALGQEIGRNQSLISRNTA